VSTDDERIADVCRSLGLVVPFRRPAQISGDETPMISVIQHVLQELKNREDYRPDCSVLLQPTSPLRTEDHIDHAIDLFLAANPDSVVSVVEVPHQFNPVSIYKKVGGLLSPFLSGEQILRRQDKPAAYARNGPAVLVLRPSVIASGSLYGQVILPYVMDPSDSVDIDSEEDLLLAEFLIRRRLPA
jgi:CMP-N-acetylneuraminic acid synthetase